jgi:plasmid stabilization system protein ParE
VLLLRSYFLSPTAIKHLRAHKKWSLKQFGYEVTKKYFEDMDIGFQFIADNHKGFTTRSELTGDTGLCIYPVKKHFVIFVPLHDDVHIVDILSQVQDIPNILSESTARFEREISQFRKKK